MALYSIALFLHIVGALGLFIALALEWTSLLQLRRATVTGQMREWAKLLKAPQVIGGPAALAVLVSGIYLTQAYWGMQGWIVAGLAGMALMATFGLAVDRRRTRAILLAIPREDGPVPQALARSLRRPLPKLSLSVRTGLALGVVFVMSAKPSAGGALLAMSLALFLGLAAGLRGFRGKGLDESAGRSAAGTLALLE